MRKRDGLQGFEQGERSILEDASVNPGLIPLEEHELMQFEQEQDTTGNQGAQDLGDYVLENSLHSQNREERKDASEFWESPKQFVLNELIDEEYELMNGKADELNRARRNERDKEREREDDFFVRGVWYLI